jgi:hypothetical protein
MNNETASVLAIIVTGVLAGIWYWNERVRRVPLEEFGLEAVNRVLRWETDGRRAAILSRGWMTSHEWTEMNKRQLKAIEAEMERQGVADDRDSQQ